MATRPLVLLDVDGVLNALAVPPPENAWTDWQVGEAVAEGERFRIVWSPSVVSAVRRWLEVADVVWLTTWGHAANSSLRLLLDLPELPVAGTYAEVAEAGRARDAGVSSDVPATCACACAGADACADADAAAWQNTSIVGPSLVAASHAAIAPAAPDPPTGRWWKFDVVRQLAEQQPGRRFVWLDDDLADERELRDWTRRRLDCLLVAPSRYSGLRPDDLTEVDAFLGLAPPT